MTRKEKLEQISKEAKISLAALAAIIIFWAVAGIGLSKLDITVFHTPLWAITGCLGTWIFAVILVWALTKYVFKDFKLEEEQEYNDK